MAKYLRSIKFPGLDEAYLIPGGEDAPVLVAGTITSNGTHYPARIEGPTELVAGESYTLPNYNEETLVALREHTIDNTATKPLIVYMDDAADTGLFYYVFNRYDYAGTDCVFVMAVDESAVYVYTIGPVDIDGIAFPGGWSSVDWNTMAITPCDPPVHIQDTEVANLDIDKFILPALQNLLPADGYSEVTVNVPEEYLAELINGSDLQQMFPVPETVTTIRYGFRYANHIRGIRCPASVQRFYQGALQGCSALCLLILMRTESIVKCDTGAADLLVDTLFAYNGEIETRAIYVPDDLVDDYKADISNGWSNYAQYIKPLSECPAEYLA